MVKWKPMPRIAYCRGKRNEPGYTRYVVETFAKERATWEEWRIGDLKCYQLFMEEKGNTL